MEKLRRPGNTDENLQDLFIHNPTVAELAKSTMISVISGARCGFIEPDSYAKQFPVSHCYHCWQEGPTADYFMVHDLRILCPDCTLAFLNDPEKGYRTKMAELIPQRIICPDPF